MMEQETLPGISLVINTLNEEENIHDCIVSAKSLVNEVIICDMYSEDRTAEIARSLGARVIDHKRTGGFVEPARRFAISHAKFQWVLVLDADERMTDPLKEKLLEIVKEDQQEVVSFWSLYWFFGAWARHGGFYNGKWTRFFRKRCYLESYSKEEELVHGNFRSLRRSDYKLLDLPSDFYIEHYAYPTFELYVTKTLGKYARIEAEQYVEMGRRFSLWRLLYEPTKEFIYRLLFRGGLKGGVHGLLLIALYSMFRFSVWGNVWAIERSKETKKTDR
ncbi:glycosyltransferase family 2 protein [Magnetococcales bacterium HHB-1]